ncbi:hypothetical protein OU415_18565 [Saccharopolyspora sp. WRP15-2]|uniref:Uncharacterized protein n=1 Tax=Saccharopolyspora oryzae TaxID=2997343 RepID=A0ABT4V2B8_9PSEU|nr:hypothetical protein [Saccharopolyspora oryzae]MDA3627452.1 hypothetical protein [Saccharopolyspora oryzae]
MTGSCALRGPRSRLALLVARVSLFSGICLGGWLGTDSIAEAADQPDLEKPQVEVEIAPPELDVVPPRAEDLHPELDEVQRPEPEPPDAVEIEPPAPVDQQEPPASVDDPDPTPMAAPTALPSMQQPSAAPPRAARAEPSPPEPVAVERTHAHSPAEPRAPNPDSADEAPLNSSDHDTDAPSQPASGTGDLRGALVVLPTGPSLTNPRTVGSKHPENRPISGLSSAEPSASPD